MGRAVITPKADRSRRSAVRCRCTARRTESAHRCRSRSPGWDHRSTAEVAEEAEVAVAATVAAVQPGTCP